MKADLFDFDLPEELIARYPAPHRSDSRMLVMDRATGETRHHLFRDLPGLLKSGDLVIGNRTRVFPARIHATKKTGGEVELLLLERIEIEIPKGERWRALARGARKLKSGAVLDAPGATLTVEGRDDEKVLLDIVTAGGEDVLAWADKTGELPLPPYLEREASEEDARRYQTVFAKEAGSVAAPTAGLHFDEEVIEALRARGILFETLRLDVGWGTFAPIRGEDIREHHLDEERYEIDKALATEVQNRKKGRKSGRVIAVGTTVTRSLETAFDQTPPQLTGRSNLYITPGYEFRVIDGLITNFHLPRTSLLVLVSAFAGREHVLAAYEEAIRERYRFYSYGDCMLIL